MAIEPNHIHSTYGFPPLLCEDPRILILGTLPGGESLAHKQYFPVTIIGSHFLCFSMVWILYEWLYGRTSCPSVLFLGSCIGLSCGRGSLVHSVLQREEKWVDPQFKMIKDIKKHK